MFSSLFVFVFFSFLFFYQKGYHLHRRARCGLPRVSSGHHARARAHAGHPDVRAVAGDEDEAAAQEDEGDGEPAVPDGAQVDRREAEELREH